MKKSAAKAVEPSNDLTPIVGANLKRIRSKRGLSLEALAQLSGVSRAMLNQVELGQSTPTINVVWKIASALGLPFSALISAEESSAVVVLKAKSAKVLGSADGSFRSRALFPFDAPRRVEFYELRLTKDAVEDAEAHAPGTKENLIVAKGSCEMRIGSATHALAEGDAILFDADVPHQYVNSGAGECVMYLVMTYADVVGS